MLINGDLTADRRNFEKWGSRGGKDKSAHRLNSEEGNSFCSQKLEKCIDIFSIAVFLVVK